MDRRKRRRLLSALQSGILEYIRSISNTAIASFTGDGRDLVRLVVGIEPVQAGSGDPSPDNIRPISGWTGANIVVSPTLDDQDGTTYSIAWQSEADTVYVGTLDVTSGILTVDSRYHDLASFEWSTYTSSGNLFFATSSLQILRSDRSIFLCDRFTPRVSQYAPTVPVANSIYEIYARYYHLNVYYPDITTLSDFQTYLQNNPTHILCKLDTPIQYTLTPTEITTLLGANNIWADTGDIILLEYMA